MSSAARARGGRPALTNPRIIQGGMGVAVSGWRLARAVAQSGQLGVVSGTGLAVVLVRRLQRGDRDGHVRRALAQFPVPGVADRILERFHVAGGKAPEAAYRLSPMPQQHLGGALTELTVAANFTEVFLARERHAGLVGINYLEKIQSPTLASLFGAMLAGVDFVLMGAGIPRSIPGVLDALARGEAVELRLDVAGAGPHDAYATRFDPAAFCGGEAPPLRRPRFLAIVASATLAQTLARKSNGRVDGFIVEGPAAGGHNAPPRGSPPLGASGEPVYGPRDRVELDQMRALGLPFWLAGGFASARGLADATARGAAGIQVGTAFAFCEESGIAAGLKARVLARCRNGGVGVFTDPRASPTGYPFKVLQLDGTLAQAPAYDARQRLCDLGYLRHAYRQPDGSLGYRCPAEPVEAYVGKGGARADTTGRKCICNALFATIDLAQALPEGGLEPALLTAGDDAAQLARFLPPGGGSYSAADVLRQLLGAAP